MFKTPTGAWGNLWLFRGNSVLSVEFERRACPVENRKDGEGKREEMGTLEILLIPGEPCC